MHLRYFVGLILALCLIVGFAPAQDTSSPSAGSASTTRKKPVTKKKSSTASTSKSTAGKKAAARRRARARSKRLSQVAVHRINRVFVASADLKPMANQLVTVHTPAAYAGAENCTLRHAETDARALGYLVLGYARFQGRHFSQALSALKKAQTRAGELAY